MPITYSQAALGTTLEVPTLLRPHELSVPAGTASGTVFRVRGQGMPHPRRRDKGDLLVEVNIEVPKKFNQRQRELLRELAELEQKHVSQHRKSFFEKVRDYFVADDENAAKAGE